MIASFTEGPHKSLTAYENFVKSSVFFTAGRNAAFRTSTHVSRRRKLHSSPYNDRSLLKENHRGEKAQSTGKAKQGLRSAQVGSTEEGEVVRTKGLGRAGELLNTIAVVAVVSVRKRV